MPPRFTPMTILPICAGVLLAAITCLPSVTFAHEQDAPAQANQSGNRVSQSRLISITDKGLRPSSLKVRTEDSIVFFLNDTSDSLTTLAVEFGNRVTHCASSNMKIEDAGTVESAKPFAPRDFASTCFHETGTYPVTVYGLRAFPQGAKGTIIVE